MRRRGGWARTRWGAGVKGPGKPVPLSRARAERHSGSEPSLSLRGIGRGRPGEDARPSTQRGPLEEGWPRAVRGPDTTESFPLRRLTMSVLLPEAAVHRGGQRRTGAQQRQIPCPQTLASSGRGSVPQVRRLWALHSVLPPATEKNALGFKPVTGSRCFSPLGIRANPIWFLSQGKGSPRTHSH